MTLTQLNHREHERVEQESGWKISDTRVKRVSKLRCPSQVTMSIIQPIVMTKKRDLFQRDNKQTVAGSRNITEYGNSMLLHEMMKDNKSLLKEGFIHHWEAVFALAIVGVSGNVPLKLVHMMLLIDEILFLRMEIR